MAFFGDKKKKDKNKEGRKAEKKSKRRKPSVVSTRARGRAAPSRGSTLRRFNGSRDQRRQIRPHFIVDPTTKRLVQVNLQNPVHGKFSDQLTYKKTSDRIALSAAVVKRPDGRKRQMENQEVFLRERPQRQPVERKKSWAENPDLGADVTLSVRGSNTKSSRQRKKVSRKEKIRKPMAEDIKKWLDWRIKVNDQLASFVTRDSDSHATQSNGTLPVMPFPRSLKEEKMKAIFQYAQTKEKPQTALDNFSYIIYGIPRVKIQGQRKSIDPLPDYTDSEGMFHYGSHELTSSTMLSEEDSPPQKSHYPRYKRDKKKSPSPTKLSPKENGTTAREHFPVYQMPHMVDTGNYAACRPTAKPLTAQRVTNISPGRASKAMLTKPPIAGAVPTVLSLCSLPQAPSQMDLRQIHRNGNGASSPVDTSYDRLTNQRKSSRPGHI